MIKSRFLALLLAAATTTTSVFAAATTSTKLIPLPVYATLPNEGSTFGFMPVFLQVEDQSQRTRAITAPSITWNRIIRWTATYRLFYYPGEDETLTLIPSVSSNVNRGLTLEWAKLPQGTGALTQDVNFHLRRSLFSRFFGLGPRLRGDETSYTRVGGDLGARVGYNFGQFFNIGARVNLQRDLVERIHVDFLPLTNDRFPGTPGLGGATTLYEGVSLRFDSRPAREYSTRGVSGEVQAGVVEGFSGSPTFSKLSAEVRKLWEEIPETLSGGARAFWSYAGGRDIPFYDQSSLGGSFLLRGFTEDRFIDKGAWEIELEQRFTLFRTHIYGVVADWRIDPFVAVGQVYQDAGDMFRYARVSGGLGFRAFVQPNVLGRVDTAIGGDGIKVYVELGYPF